MSDQERATAGQGDADRWFADRLRVLVETMLGPQGAPYTPREIADGTGLSQHYVRMLLRGGVAMPAADRVQRLAVFFGVDSGYFTRSEPSEAAGRRSEEDVDAEIRRMLDDPWLIQVARRSAGMGRAQKEALLQMIDVARKLVDADKAATYSGRADGEAGAVQGRDVERHRGEERSQGGD